MPDLNETTRRFLDALVGDEPAAVDPVLAEDATLRIARWDGMEAYRGRASIAERLYQERSAWPDPVLEVLSILGVGERVAVEFRIQATEHRRYVEHNRSAFLTFRDNLVQVVELYCPASIPSARRKNWIAPASMNYEEVERLFESLVESIEYIFDVRDRLPPEFRGRLSRSIALRWSRDTHPGSNEVGGVRWSDEEADGRIEDIISEFRARHAGFTWSVGKYDTPADLCERLERHGLVLAGDQSVMARLGLDDLSDIPVNPALEIEEVDGSNAESMEAGLQIRSICFNWTPEQTAERRVSMLEMFQDPHAREGHIFYLGRLDGKPVADAHLVLKGGIAYLGGACTLRDYRSRKIYSTLLRRRLQDAHERGYHIAAIHAEPMSRRVVSRYRFKEDGRQHLYVWMPVIDMQVVKSLVPDE